jgi:vacuolar protein sorting-associated protein 29
MSEVGELVLLIGDLQIPTFARDLPDQFKELLNTDKIRTVLCTGNVGNDEFHNRLHMLGQHVHMMKKNSDAPIVTTIGKFKVALASGLSVCPRGDKASLAALARRLDVDILVTGGTGKASIADVASRYLIDPGSATGVGKFGNPETPSFMLMAVQGDSAVVYVYEVKDDKLNVVMSEIRKLR